MRLFLDNRRHLLTAFHDTVMAGLSFLLALYLRLGNPQAITRYIGETLTQPTLICMAICCIVFSRMRLYKGIWRYASAADLVAITQAATVAILLFYLSLFLLNRLEGIPRSVPFIQWLLLLALLGGPRFVYRIWRDRRLGLRTSLRGDNRIPVVLIGAGDRAELFLRDTRSGPSSQYLVVGIVDDNPSRQGRSIHNITIFGRVDELPRVVEQLSQRGVKPQRAILTYETMEGPKIRRLLDMTDKLGIPLSRLPRLSDFKQGMKDKTDIHPIAVEDLLGRAQNVHDTKPVREFVSGKVVVVTGAGGTIGSELVRQIAGFGPSKLILIEASEYALYLIDRELGQHFPNVPRMALIADVRNSSYLDMVFAREKPEAVFHAAAIKHVPLAEANIEETVLTNVLGTKNVADACAKAGVLVMVLISTDKAVNPTSVMGATKRAAENYCQALGEDAAARGITRFVAVRFGNVLGSTGSVVPLFQKQLNEGGPLTVTHPDMVRYFMTVREAVELVLQAATLAGRNGEVYVLDMGQPVRILDLAEQMIRLAGLKPYSDINIEFTGLRPGEKMFEELFHFAEDSAKTGHESIWLASPRHVPMNTLLRTFEELFEACNKRRAKHVVEVLKRAVPEYHNYVSPEK
jgi:O-antigen biosynthesis protein WbqV